MPPNHISKEAVEAVLIPAGNKVTLIGGGSAALMSFMHSNAGWISGVVIALLGYFTSLYFQRRRDAREKRQLEMEEREDDRREREHVRRMQKMMSQPAPLEGEAP